MSQTEKFCEEIERLCKQKESDKNIQSNDILDISLSISSIDDTETIPQAFREQLLELIRDILKCTHRDLQKATLTLLCQCFDVNLFTKDFPLAQLFQVIINESFCKNHDHTDDQELWIKAFEALLLIAENIDLSTVGKQVERLLIIIHFALKSTLMSTPLKYKVNRFNIK